MVGTPGVVRVMIWVGVGMGLWLHCPLVGGESHYYIALVSIATRQYITKRLLTFFTGMLRKEQ